MSQLVLWLTLIIPWASLFFMDQYSIKRFMPVGMLGALLVSIIFEIAYKYNWWSIQKGIFPWEHFLSYPLIFGAFLVGTIWIFRFAYIKSFWIYILTNLVVDALYAFVIINVFIYLEIYSLDRMNNFGIYMLMILISFMLYAYQRWQDKIIKKAGQS